MVIDSFTGKFSFLSNFYCEPDGTCVEGEFQMAKCRDWKDMERFIGLSPYESRTLGRRIAIIPEWDEVRVQVMKDFVRKKFNDHRALKLQLLSTFPHDLVEGNRHGDRFWGVSGGVGKNQLGKILMDIRWEFFNTPTSPR